MRNDFQAPMAFQPLDPDFAQRVRESLSRQGFMRTMGATIEALAPGFCEIHVPFDEGLSQQHGFFHGGVVGTLADNAGGYAAYTLMPAEASVLTVEFKVNLLAPAQGEVLISRGEVLRAGRTLTISRSRVYVRRNGTEKQCAEGLITLMTLHGQPDTAQYPAGGR